MSMQYYWKTTPTGDELINKVHYNVSNITE